MGIKAPRGTTDIYGEELEKLERLERLCANTAKLWGYSGIRTPIFEHTSLFTRSIGEVTDIVEKEMFTIPRQTKKEGADSFTLRPENTAGVVRAYLEHNLHKTQGLTKLSYLGPQFRRERPQKGRLREFNQMGVEVLGLQKGETADKQSPPLANLEVMLLAAEILVGTGLGGYLVLRYSSVGCSKPGCRDSYRSNLKHLLADEIDRLCADCKKRIDRNVFRVLDCKKPNCREVCGEVLTLYPGQLSQAFCDNCLSELEYIKHGLENYLPRGIAHLHDQFLVRGLDYYTGTVFEFDVLKLLGAQDAVGGGGRYDGLIEELGGPSLGATGFALGLERILIAQKEAGATGVKVPTVGPLVYVALKLPRSTDGPNFYGYGSEARLRMARDGYKLVVDLRNGGLNVEFDVAKHGRKISNAMKNAAKLGARCTVIIGEQEDRTKTANLKNMATREECRVQQSDLAAKIRKILNHTAERSCS